MRLRTAASVLLPALVVGVGAWWWIADPGTHEIVDELAVDADGEPLDERELAARERRELQARARNLSQRSDDRVSSEHVPYGDGQIDRAAAETAFEEVMTEIETFAKSRERIHREEWDALYRSANDAFAILSVHLDAAEPGDRETLEDAHRRLQNGLRRVRVRGKKFSDI
jgi:hypothetical protein